MSSLPSSTGPASGTFFSQRLRLHYVDWGNPAAPPLLLVHGGRDHCRNWDFVAERLRDRYHIIAPDLRGHGDSEWARNGSYGMAPYIYDLAQLIERQKLAPVTIIAHSLGGMISLRYAGLYPQKVARIVSIEGLGSSPKQQAETMAKRLVGGPTFAHGMTKTMLNQEWNMSLDQAIEAEAQAQALCMQTKDFARAYHAFVAKETPRFEGN